MKYVRRLFVVAFVALLSFPGAMLLAGCASAESTSPHSPSAVPATVTAPPMKQARYPPFGYPPGGG